MTSDDELLWGIIFLVVFMTAFKFLTDPKKSKKSQD